MLNRNKNSNDSKIFASRNTDNKANSTNTGEIAQMPKIKDILCKIYKKVQRVENGR